MSSTGRGRPAPRLPHGGPQRHQKTATKLTTSSGRKSPPRSPTAARGRLHQGWLVRFWRQACTKRQIPLAPGPFDAISKNDMSTTEIAPAPQTMWTLADLRRQFGPSQAAFARRVGLTQAQVSQLERGRRTPHAETVKRVAQSLRLPEDEVAAAFRHTQEIAADPDAWLTYRFQRAVADLYPRQTSGGKLDLSGRMIGLGEQLMLAFAHQKPLKWFSVGQTAYDAFLALSDDWRNDQDRAVSRAAFRAVAAMARDATRTYRERLELSDWTADAAALVGAAERDDIDGFDRVLDDVFSTVLSVAGTSPAFADAISVHRQAANMILMRPVRDQGRLTAVQAQLFATNDLLLGVAEALQVDADDAEQPLPMFEAAFSAFEPGLED